MNKKVVYKFFIIGLMEKQKSTSLFRQAETNLQHYWGYDSFRPGQDEAIRSVLNKEDTVVLFPTGGGKSLCYQVPATVLEGMTLVISPLVALMQDQVQQLNQRGISATFINSTLSSWEVEQRLVNARNGMYSLLYCAPERLKTDLWIAELANLNLDLIAIDEAHCISEWGHDFRPSYREIRPSLEPIADRVNWVALTATATPEVRKDIIRNLQLEEARVVAKGFDRPNLKWWVIPVEKKQEKLLKSVKKASEKGTGLIYGGTRRNCEQLAQRIESKLGIQTKAYHAGIEPEQRKNIQQEWISGTLPLVVATNAFGMGIDKADCRYVIHYTMPYSLEAYYQEAGRAGRDGKESYPILFYKSTDVFRAEQRLKDSYPQKDQLQTVYDGLCDTFNLAIGSGMEKAEQISLEALKKRSHLPLRIIHSALKVLNQLGVIQLLENVTPQIGLQFMVSEDYLRDKIDDISNRQKADFLDKLFRQFGTEAFGKKNYLEMDYLKRKFNTSANGIIKGLEVLQSHDHLLNYEAIGELPLVKLIDERIGALPFGKKEIEKHRDSLLKKLQYMKGYIETSSCREVYIRSYFGEEQVEPCHHCDNCLEAHKIQRSEITDEGVLKLKNLLAQGEKSFSEIRQATQWDQNRIKKSLSYLIRENRIEYRSDKYAWKD